MTASEGSTAGVTAAEVTALEEAGADLAKVRLTRAPKMLVCDIDETLVTHDAPNPAAEQLHERLRARGDDFAFVVSTGRNLQQIHEVLEEFDVPHPDVLVASVGTEIYYGKNQPEFDEEYQRHIERGWLRKVVEARVRRLPWLVLQRSSDQNPNKVSFLCDEAHAYRDADVKQALGSELAAETALVWSHGKYLDVLPKRATKGGAVNYLAERWQLDLGSSVTAGDSGNDRAMLQGHTRGIVVGGYAPELEDLRGRPRVYFASGLGSAGVLEGLAHYGF